MKSAGDVANSIIEFLDEHDVLLTDTQWAGLGTKIIEALNAFAEKRVKEALLNYRGRHPLVQCYCVGKDKYIAELCRGCHCRIGYEWEEDSLEHFKVKARADALEEAEKIAQNFDGGTVHRPYDWIAVKTGIASVIRALKDAK